MLRFTLVPVFLALFIGVLCLPALNVWKVTSRGMGVEHAQPWRRTAADGLAAVAALALCVFARLKQRFARVQRHALFRPAVAAVALLVAAMLNYQALFALPL